MRIAFAENQKTAWKYLHNCVYHIGFCQKKQWLLDIRHGFPDFQQKNNRLSGRQPVCHAGYGLTSGASALPASDVSASWRMQLNFSVKSWAA